jgi:predicted ATPase
MALVTLLMLPDGMLPSAIILDEPELGLHPAAESVIAGLIKDASQRCQILLSTQSATFLDQFSPTDVLVVENEEGESRFISQSDESLGPWLERYTLGQIWCKNLMGGRP